VEESSKIVPNKGEGPVTVTGILAKKADLAETVKAVNGAKTPHKSQSPPGLALVLFAELDNESADAATKVLGKVKGVDAKGSKADAKKGEISVRIAGKEKVTVADVLTALKDAGVNASLAKAKD